MNKVVAILGVIVLITLGGLFFCAGFFTGTTVFPTLQSAGSKNFDPTGPDSEKGISLKDVESVVDSQSSGISDKILAILASAAESASSSLSEVMDKKPAYDASSHVTIDSLLREIAASHATDDKCSIEKTTQDMSKPIQINQNSLHGKRIVFIGYFKNNIALEIQKLLTEKGYVVHVEASQTGSGESFIFCGPFKKGKNAEKLVKWLRKHDFSEARIVSVSDDSIEETLYEAINDDINLPENNEKNIPEMPLPHPPSVQLQPQSAVPVPQPQSAVPVPQPQYAVPVPQPQQLTQVIPTQ